MSILVTVGRIASCLVCLLLALVAAAQQDSAPTKQPDTFFAGSVTEATSEKITISRVVSGKTEKRTFRVTPETKVEGKLRVRVRVTVRYMSDDDGEVATLIVVRAPQPKK